MVHYLFRRNKQRCQYWNTVIGLIKITGMMIGGAAGFFVTTLFTVNIKGFILFKEVIYIIPDGTYDATATSIHYPTGIALMTMLFGFYIA